MEPPAPPLTLGEYMRRLRRHRGRSLLQIAEETGISYTHLSRIEADSTLPNADTVTKIATSLDGDLRLMLEMARCLPQVILDRMVETAGDRQSATQLRAANLGSSGGAHDEPSQLILALVQAFNFSASEANEMALAIGSLAALPIDRRTLLITLIHNLRSEGSGGTR